MKAFLVLGIGILMALSNGMVNCEPVTIPDTQGQALEAMLYDLEGREGLEGAPDSEMDDDMPMGMSPFGGERKLMRQKRGCVSF